jgi:hypothetical protein
MVMDALSDTKSLYILSRVAVAEVDSQFLLSETRLSTRAFYSRMSRLLKLGIVSRKNGKYSLSSFGEIVYHAQDLIMAALNNYWRLSALDSLSMLDALPIAEYNKITSTLLGNQQIRKVLARQLEQITNNDYPILLNAAPLSTQRSRGTARGRRASDLDVVAK